MGYHSNLYINFTTAKSANDMLIGKLKRGWEQDGELKEEQEKLNFTATLYHDDFDGEPKLSYKIDDTDLIGIDIELNSKNSTDTVKKGFSNNDEDMESEDMIQFAAKTINLGMDLLLLKK